MAGQDNNSTVEAPVFRQTPQGVQKELLDVGQLLPRDANSDSTDDTSNDSQAEHPFVLSIDRSDEIFELQQAEGLGLIMGPAGCGKTHLGRTAVYSKSLLYGKFSLNAPLDPFRVLEQAFGCLVSEDEDRNDELRSRIAAGLTKSDQQVMASLLRSIIPILPDVDSTFEHHRVSRNKADRGIEAVVCRFIRTLCKGEPMVIFFDDLHLASEQLLKIIELLAHGKHPGLRVIGAVDDGRSYKSDYLAEIVSKCTRVVRMRNLSLDQLSQSLKKMPLSSTEQEVQLFAETLFHHTGGNLFYLYELIGKIRRSGVLKACNNKYELNMRSIEKQRQTDPWTLDHFLRTSLEEILSVDQKEILKVAAAFGSHLIEKNLVELLFGLPVDEELEYLRTLGIIEVLDEELFSFSHDTMQQAAYAMIPKDGQELFHLEVGRRLWRSLHDKDLFLNLRTVMWQYMRGSNMISRSKERTQLATLCLQAGSEAAKCVNLFDLAVISFEFGIRLLKGNGWTDQYEVMLKLHGACAEMQMSVGNMTRMEEVIDEVLLHAREPLDKSHVLQTRVYNWGVLDRGDDAIELGLETLQQLGVHLPRRWFSVYIAREALRARALLKGKSDEQLMRLPTMKNDLQYAVLQMLNVMYLSCLIQRPTLAAVVSLKLINITLKHGNSVLSCIAFSAYAMFLVAAGDTEGAIRYGELSLKLLESCGSIEYLPRVYAGVYGVIYSWRFPSRDALDNLLQGYYVGLQTGDKEFACLCANGFCFTALDSGTRILEVLEKYETFQTSMVTNHQRKLLNMISPFVQAIRTYADSNGDPLAYQSYVTNHTITEIKSSNDVEILFACMMICYVFSDYERAASFLYGFNHVSLVVPSFNLVVVHFMKAMLLLALSRQETGRRSRRWLLGAQAVRKKVKTWARESPHNGLALLYHIDAEIASVAGNNAKAYEKYISAINFATQEQSRYHIALANERCAHHFYDLNQKDEAMKFFKKAISAYEDWGGHAVKQRLQREMANLYSVRGP